MSLREQYIIAMTRGLKSKTLNVMCFNEDGVLMVGFSVLVVKTSNSTTADNHGRVFHVLISILDILFERDVDQGFLVSDSENTNVIFC